MTLKDLQDMAKRQDAAQAFNQTFAAGPRSKAEPDALLKKLNGSLTPYPF